MGKVELGVGDILIVPDGTCTSCLKLLRSLLIVSLDVNAKFSGREGSAPANDFIPLSPMRSSSFEDVRETESLRDLRLMGPNPIGIVHRSSTSTSVGLIFVIYCILLQLTIAQWPTSICSTPSMSC